MAEAFADMAYKTVSVLKEISLELPKIKSLEDASKVLIREDRKMHVGIALVILALVVVVLHSA
nr:hypothetical protein TetV2_00538 [Oceanusvirus sp.]